MDFTMKDINQEIIKFNYDGNFKEDDFYVSKSNKQIFELTGLSGQGINRALDRQWSVAFLNPPDEIFEKVKLISESYNVHVFKGNRMSHLLSNESHKGQAVNKLKIHFIRQAKSE